MFTFGVSFTMDTIPFTLETASSLETSHLYLSRQKHTKVHAATYKKTMLMQKIATTRPVVELAKVHHAILLRDAAPVRSCRADCRNTACSCGILSGNRCHPTLPEDLSDLEITWHLGHLGLKTLTHDAAIQNSYSLSSSISSTKLDAIVHPHLIRV